MVWNRMDSSGARQKSWPPIQRRPHLQGSQILGILKDTEVRYSLTQDFAHCSFEIEHTGSLIISRNFIRSTVEHFELFHEARV